MSDEPIRLRSGAIVQAGLRAGNRHDQRQMLGPRHSLYRAVVINTRVAQSADPPTPSTDQLRVYQVECDVIMVASNARLMNVPVMQRQHGVNNVHDLWIPRPTTRVVSGSGQLNVSSIYSRRRAFNGPITPLDDLDGDMVLISFVEGDPNYPMIVGALSHERTNRIAVEGSGWSEGLEGTTRGVPQKNEMYSHHYGTEVRVNHRGDFLVDTVGAYQNVATEDESAAGGLIKLMAKQTEAIKALIGTEEMIKLVQAQATLANTTRVALGSEGVSQAFVKGTSFMSHLSAFLLALSNPTGVGLAQALLTAHGPLGTYPEPTLAAAAATLAASVALLQGQLPFDLSTKVFGE